MNKILIVTADAEEQERIEEILYDFVERGAELFMAATKEHALAIVERERPQLVFVDFSLGGETSLPTEGVHIVTLEKPIRAEWLQAKCTEVLDFTQKSGPPLPL